MKALQTFSKSDGQSVKRRKTQKGHYDISVKATDDQQNAVKYTKALQTSVEVTEGQ